MRKPLPQNALTNPTFVGQSTAGWTLQPGWAIGTGAPFGDGSLVLFTGPGTSAVINNTRINVEPGGVVKAQCWAVGEIGAGGYACIRVEWFDQNGNYMYASPSAFVSNNYVWVHLTTLQIAPTNAAYAQIDFAVLYDNSVFGRWGCTQFWGAYLPGTIGRDLVRYKLPLSYYLSLFTSQYKMSANLNAWQTALMTPLDDLTNCLQTFNISYDIDNALGSQLDVLGKILGASRTVPFQPSGGVSPVLDDDDYRLLLYATQVKDTWDGTMASIYQAWQFIFPNGLLGIHDNQNMTASITTSGAFTSIEQDLITKGYIVPRPEGVQYNASGGGITTGLFGFDRNDSTVAGFDIGLFA